MQSAAKSNMAARMFHGGSGGRSSESFWKKTNHGNFTPACRKTPAEAAARRYQTTSRWAMPAASEIMDLETKPDVNGNAEIDRAPTMPHTVVTGIVRNRPPRSVH